MHRVTLDWLNSHRTANNGFTRAQIEALGVSWPPRKGWMNEVSGKLITFDKHLEFQNGKHEFKKMRRDQNIKH